jgi:hypothetical protein
MYKTKEIEDLSAKLEASEISPSDCLSILTRINNERLQLKERCDALNTLAYIEKAKERSAKFDKDPIRSDAFFQLKDVWNNTRVLTNTNVIEGIKFTKAYEDGLICDVLLAGLNIETVTFSEAMTNLKRIIK